MKRKNIIYFAIIFIITVLISTISYGAEDVIVQKSVPSTDGSITFEFSGLELEEGEDYQWAIEKSQTATIENWYNIMSPNYEKGEVEINVNVTNGNQLAVLKSTDTAYITIRKVGEETNLLDPYKVDLTLPLLKAFSLKFSAGTLISAPYGINCNNIKILWEKITDAEIVNSYIDDNHDLSELKLKGIEDFPSFSNTTWKKTTGYNTTSSAQLLDSDKPKEDGLYYLWIVANDTDVKTIKGYYIYEVGEVKKITSSTTDKEPGTSVDGSHVDKTPTPTTKKDTTTITAKDGTTSSKKIPFAGKGIILVISILAILIISYILKVKYNFYKDIK